MARAHFRHAITDRNGNAVQNAAVYLYQPGTTTEATTKYNAVTGGATVTNPLLTNNQGEVECWFDSAQTVDIYVTDNSNAAYYPNDSNTLLSWTPFTEAGVAPHAPEDLGASITPASTVASETSFGISAAVGVGTDYARNDHTHGSPTNPVTAHEGAGDPHTGYRLESADHDHSATGLQGGQIAHTALTTVGANDHHAQSHGNADHTTAFTDDTTVNAHIADTTDAHDASAISVLDTAAQITATDVEGALAEIVDAAQAHEGAGDPHTGYRLESADHTHASAGAEGGQIAHTALTTVGANDHHNQSHDHSAAGDGQTVSPATLIAPGATTPAQTAEGSVVWDTDNDQLTVGDGVGRKTLMNSGDAAGGDLGGTYPNPTVTDDSHAHSSSTVTTHSTAHAVDDLSDVTITTPSTGQVIKYNGSIWVNDTDATGAGATITVQKGDVDVDTAAGTLDFDGTDFNVTSSPAGEANITITDDGHAHTSTSVTTHSTGHAHADLSSVTADQHHAQSHGNTDHTSTFITAAGVTYENLSANADIGTGSTQVSQGDHTHAGAGHTIADAGTPLTQRATLDFQDGFALADNAGAGSTDVDIDYEGTPSTQAFGDAAAGGAATTVTRGDHKHAMPANPVTAHEGTYAHANIHAQSHDHSAAGDGQTLTPATLNVPYTDTPAQTAEGQMVWDSDGNFLTVGDGSSRQTFHPTVDATSDPLAVSTAAADGTEASVARKDHVHPHEAAHINHDTTWAAKGDLIAATANDTAAVLGVGTNGQYLEAASGQSTGLQWASQVFSITGTILSPTTAMDVIVWRAPFACTVTAIKGYRTGGTGATINAQKNGSLTHRSANLSLTSTSTWMDGGSVQNTSYAVGDKLEIVVASVTGSPSQVAIQVDFTRP